MTKKPKFFFMVRKYMVGINKKIITLINISNLNNLLFFLVRRKIYNTKIAEIGLSTIDMLSKNMERFLFNELLKLTKKNELA